MPHESVLFPLYPKSVKESVGWLHLANLPSQTVSFSKWRSQRFCALIS